MKVASVTAPTAIAGIVGAAVLFGDDMLQVKRGRGRGEIGKPAILAPAAVPLADELAEVEPVTD